jgi:hypothetical protein
MSADQAAAFGLIGLILPSIVDFRRPSAARESLRCAFDILDLGDPLNYIDSNDAARAVAKRYLELSE